VAKVFISYERSAEATARTAGDLLRARGHEIWWDAEIPPHRDYGDVIAERLQAADAVLVLWSDGAAQSHWVRAEADHALEHGKLVQASLDATPLPLPFNRIQFARLPGWTGDAQHPEWLKVLGSIEQIAAGSAVLAAPAPSAALPLTGRGHEQRIRAALKSGVAAVAVLVLAAVAIWLATSLRRQAAPPRATRVAVLPFDVLTSDPDTRFFADGLTDQIATTLSRNHVPVLSRADASTLRGSERDAAVARLGVAMLLDGTVQRGGDSITVRMHLDDAASHAIVWSAEETGLATEGEQIQGRIATTVVNALACSNRALAPGSGLSDPALLGRYLRACDLFSNRIDHGGRPEETLEMLAALREITVKAPEFVAAHTDLAKFSAYLALRWPPEQAAAMRKEAADEAQRALALDPHAPDAFLTQAFLLPIDHYAEREQLLRRGVAADPSWPHTKGFLAQVLAGVGRVQEAITVAQGAAAADLQIDWSDLSVWLVSAGGGATAPCIDMLSHRLALRPRDNLTWWYLIGCRTDARQWTEARAMLASDTAPLAGTKLGAASSAFYEAMLAPSPENRERARRLMLDAAVESLPISIMDLGALGMVDDAFALAEHYDPNAWGDPSLLFLKSGAPLRRDPRFMRLAARIRLVDYWQTTGHWPDYCGEPGLPYDCKAEAERITKP